MKNSLVSRKLTEVKATTPAQHLGISQGLGNFTGRCEHPTAPLLLSPQCAFTIPGLKTLLAGFLLS